MIFVNALKHLFGYKQNTSAQSFSKTKESVRQEIIRKYSKPGVFVKVDPEEADRIEKELK